MNILIIGKEINFKECKLKFGESHSYTFLTDRDDAIAILKGTEIVFDFIPDQYTDTIKLYSTNPLLIVFVNTCKVSLAELIFKTNRETKNSLIGFCGLPTLLNRNLLEVSLHKKEDAAILENSCENLNTSFSIVDDRVGLVTPRVICMIINEAYYTVQEGTASREDIDQAMKLGTNYPFGPFEWAQLIGVKEVYEILEAVYEDTKDDRYKICPLLKKEYFKI
jgi:3-hydroxybutyryl-CoA dehydrogenase